MTLVELLIAALIGTVLLTGLVQVAAGARSSFRLQEARAEVQESGRFAIDTLGGILRQSAFTPEPWTESSARPGVTGESQDAVSRHGDRLALATWNERNCFGAPNPVSDADGLPRFFLQESVLEMNGAGNLIHTCRYGPTAMSLVTQLRRQGLVQNVEAFQVLYAEDTDQDGAPDRWTRAGPELDPAQVLGLQIAVLIASSESVDDPRPRTLKLLDHVVNAPGDGRLRRVFTHVQPLRHPVR